MEEKKVMISGANGYFGTIACQYFESQGWQVLKACRRNDPDVFFDLDCPETFASLKINTKINVFIHAAAAHEVTCRQQPYRSVMQNVVGTKSALDFCVNNNIEHFVYLSTFHVFGNPNEHLDESTEPYPDNDYGLSHLQAEQYVQMYIREGKIKGMIIRPSNFFGIPVNLDQCKRWSLVPLSFCREAIETGQIFLKTSGLQKRNFVSILDTCRVINYANLMKYPTPLLHIFGVNTISIISLAKLVQQVMKIHLNKDIQVIVPQSPSSEVLTTNQEFNYTSKYLSDIYKPVEKLEDFIIDFCQLLEFKKHYNQ